MKGSGITVSNLGFNHCKTPVKQGEIFKIPAVDVGISSFKFIDLCITKCSVCKKTLLYYRGLNDSGIPVGEWRQVDKKSVAKWLLVVAEVGQVFIQRGVDWVWGSNPQFPFNKRKIRVR